MFSKTLLRSAAIALMALGLGACATTEGGMCDRPCCAKMQRQDCCCKNMEKKCPGMMKGMKGMKGHKGMSMKKDGMPMEEGMCDPDKRK